MADLLHDAVMLNNKVLCDPMLPFGMVAMQSDFLAIRTRFAYFLQFCTCIMLLQFFFAVLHLYNALV